jgi:hypothetical protein
MSVSVNIHKVQTGHRQTFLMDVNDRASRVRLPEGERVSVPSTAAFRVDSK